MTQKISPLITGTNLEPTTNGSVAVRFTIQSPHADRDTDIVECRITVRSAELMTLAEIQREAYRMLSEIAESIVEGGK